MKTLSDHILDIIENSAVAKATLIEIILTENKNDDLYTLEIGDNGCGMTKETALKALDPFYTSRTTRKVGLGLPLLKHNAEQSGGDLAILSELGKGTRVTARFGLTHIDRPALGDMAGVFLLSASGHPDIEFRYLHTTDDGSYSISSAELTDAAGDLTLIPSEVRKAVVELISFNLEQIKASK